MRGEKIDVDASKVQQTHPIIEEKTFGLLAAPPNLGRLQSMRESIAARISALLGRSVPAPNNALTSGQTWPPFSLLTSPSGDANYIMIRLAQTIKPIMCSKRYFEELGNGPVQYVAQFYSANRESGLDRRTFEGIFWVEMKRLFGPDEPRMEELLNQVRPILVSIMLFKRRPRILYMDF